MAKFGATFTQELELSTTGTTGLNKARIIIKECGLSITLEEWVKLANETSWAMLEAEVVDLMPGVTKLINHLHKHKVPIGKSLIAVG